MSEADILMNSTLTMDQSSSLMGSLVAASSIIMIPAIIVSILLIIAMWKIFTKANQPGWAAIIPVYNSIVLFKVAGLNPLLVLVFLAGLIPFIGYFIILGLMIYLYINLAKSFGKSTGFTVGLVLLPVVFLSILAFDSSKHIGETN